MPANKAVPATDSSRDLRRLVGDDATADFENDPTFAESNPTASASSENLALQRDTDDLEESEDEIEEEDEDDEDEEDLEDEEYEDEDDDEDVEDDEDEIDSAAARLYCGQLSTGS